MSKPEVASNTDQPELAGNAQRRAPSRRLLRSIWFGLFIGVLPSFSPLFWLVLPLSVIANGRVVVMILAAVVGHLLYPQLDEFVEPIGIAVLQSPLAHASLSQLAQVGLLNSLQWYNSVTAGYITIFVCGIVVIAFMKQAFRLGMAIGTTNKTEPAKISAASSTHKPQVLDIAPEQSVLSEVAVIEQTVQAAIKKVDKNKTVGQKPRQPIERTVIVHEGHSQLESKGETRTQEPAIEHDRHQEQAHRPAIIDLNDQVWEIPCFVENEIENVLLDEILQSMPCIVSSAESSVGNVHVNDVATTETLSLSNKHNKKRRKITVKETIIDIVRWKKPGVQNVRALSSETPQVKTSDTSPAIHTTDAAQQSGRASSVPQANLQQLANSTIVMATEPLPYLMGYLSNLNRSSEKSGGR